MNYGKLSTDATKKRLSSKSGMVRHKIGTHLFRLFLLVILVGIAAGALYGIGLYRSVLADSPNVTPEDVSPVGFTSFVYTKDGKKLGEFVASGSNRIFKSLEEIPEDTQHAFVAIEDERFYEHNGVDVKGIMRAAYGIITRNSSQGGASTITQQLIKNNVFSNFTEEKTFSDRLHRKIQEQYLAVRLEKQMTKDEILEDYLNTINLGQNSLGIQAAATRYFNKDVSELTLSESAVIAAITKNPGHYNPISSPEDNATRRKRVLKKMLEQDYITKEQYDEALQDDVYSRIQNVNAQVTNDTTTDSYFMDALADQLMDDLQTELGYSETQAYNAVYRGGLTVTATIDERLQQICDEEANNNANYPAGIKWGITSYNLTITRADGTVENYDQNSVKAFGANSLGDSQGLLFGSPEEAQGRIAAFKDTLGITEDVTVNGENMAITPQPQSSVVVMDQKTGEVKAIVGGRGDKTTNRSYNRAINAMRQPGSCFKILAVYAPALDAKGKNLCTYIKDEPFKYADGTDVHNWWGNSYRGDQTVRKAIEQSMNVCAVKMITEITPRLGFEYCQKFGITTLVDNEKRSDGVYTDVQQPLALGGITYGVKNIELTGAYATIANGGVYNKPIFYTEIKDHDGNVLLDNTEGNSKRVLKESTAWLLTDAMIGVVTSGTGGQARLRNMTVSGKTGSTTDNKDIWFCAYTPYYTCGVWAGYDDNAELSNTSFHLVLWRSIMSRIHEGLDDPGFPESDQVEKMTVCARSGKLPSVGCASQTEWIAKENIPTEKCTSEQCRGAYQKYLYYQQQQKKQEEEQQQQNTAQPDAGAAGGGTGGDAGGGTGGGGADTGGGGGGADTGGGGGT